MYKVLIPSKSYVTNTEIVDFSKTEHLDVHSQKFLVININEILVDHNGTT